MYMSDKTLFKIIVIIGFLLLLWQGNVESRKNQPPQSHEERQQNIDTE